MSKKLWLRLLVSSVVFLAVLLIAGPLSIAAAPSARDIMVKNEEARQIRNVTSRTIMTSAMPGGRERVKEFDWWRKLAPDNVHFRTLTLFNKPAEIVGEKVLFIENDKDINDVLMYLPNFKKTRRVESQQQSKSFMGSHFSYADIASPHVDDFKYKLLREEPCSGDSAAIRCYVIEAVPATDQTRERTGYSRNLMWIRQDNFMAAQVEYFDIAGKPWKRMSASKIQEVDKARHRWLAHHVRMENLQKGGNTVLEFTQVRTEGEIKDAYFNPNNLNKDL